MDIKRLEYFCAIIEKGQISKAAKSLHISQPPLSMRLKELEEELGTPLIYRKGKDWQVTPEGHWLYQRAQFILSYMEGIKNDIACFTGTLHGLVRMGICPPCRRIASSVLTEMAKEHPQLRFRVWIMDNQSLERHLQESHLDFALVLLPVSAKNYTLQSLRPKPYYAVFGQGMPRPEAEAIPIDDLVDLPLVVQHRRDGSGVNTVLLNAFQKINRQPHIVLETQDSSLLQTVLTDGFAAVGILNEYEVKGTPLEEFPTAALNDEGLRLMPALITLKNAYVSTPAQKMMDWIAERF